ncbi:MAG: alanine dehydrogenase [Marinilabiliales bacterium]|nr:MAG: alanine dehydrogenase [Marinilabiliales bacterium]
MVSFGSASTNFSLGNPEKLLPQEEMLEVGKKHQELSIAILKESTSNENRIPLTPLAVDLLVNNGHSVYIEGDAGKCANFQDRDYSEAGAQVLFDKEELLKKDIIIKVSSLTEEEIELMPGKQIIFTVLHPHNRTQKYFRSLMQKRITAMAFEYLKDQFGNHQIVRSMSEISGTTSVLIAAEYLSNVHNGKGEMLGGITGVTPTEVVVLGSGTAAEYAIKTAIGLGARVKVFDTDTHRLRQLQQKIGFRLYTSILLPKVVDKALRSADVVIGAFQNINGKHSFIVTEEMVQKMKMNSVIIDIDIDRGGTFETSKLTTHSNPVFIEHGVIHYCVPNIASRVARTASYALSNIITPVILDIGFCGGIKQLIKESVGVRSSVYLFNGILTNNYVGELHDISSKDIDLLLAAF